MTVIDLDTITLSKGAHRDPGDGMCLVEAAAYVAGLPFSDHPDCVCPAIGAFARSWNDSLSDVDRNRLLKPFITKIVNTRSTPDVQDARAFLAADWTVRTFTPAWLRLAGLEADAAALESLPPLTSTKACQAAMTTIRAASQSAAAARPAAWAAAWAAARPAAGDALAPTVLALQESAVDLFDRMIALGAS